MQVKVCDLCGKRGAKYICQECGRSICERCIEPYSWLCIECYERTEAPRRLHVGIEEKVFPQLPFTKMFLLGFILIFIGTIILILAALISGLKDSFGLTIFIGPIPIILGAGQYSPLLIVLAVILTLLGIVAFIFLGRRGIKFSRRESQHYP